MEKERLVVICNQLITIASDVIKSIEIRISDFPHELKPDLESAWEDAVVNLRADLAAFDPDLDNLMSLTVSVLPYWEFHIILSRRTGMVSMSGLNQEIPAAELDANSQVLVDHLVGTFTRMKDVFIGAHQPADLVCAVPGAAVIAMATAVAAAATGIPAGAPKLTPPAAVPVVTTVQVRMADEQPPSSERYAMYMSGSCMFIE